MPTSNQLPKTKISEVITAFITDRKAMGVSKRTIALYRFELDNLTTWLDGQEITALDDMTPDVIRRYLLALEAKGRNEGGRHIAYRVIKSMSLFWEQETDGDYRPAIRKVKIKRPPDDPQDPIERGDFDKLLESCGADWFGVRDGAIIRVLLDTGIRAQELCNLDLSDLDIPGGAATVRRGKGKKTRPVYFGRDTRKILRRWTGKRGSESGPLFTTQEGDKLTYWGLREIIRRRAKDAGIPEPGLHDFRRAFTLAQLQAGVDVVTISRLLGHSDITLVARYAKQKPQDLQAKYKSPVDDGGE